MLRTGGISNPFPPGHEDLPSPRVCRLLLRAMGRWKERTGWVAEEQIGHLFRGRDDLGAPEKKEFAANQVANRKALATPRMLELIVSRIARTPPARSRRTTDHRTLPPFSVGQGKEFVGYLTEEEELEGALNYLNERSAMGHIVPDHGWCCRMGSKRWLRMSEPAAQGATPEQDFYESVALSLEAVIVCAACYAERARGRLPATDPNRGSLEQVAEWLRRAANPAPTFHEACRPSTSCTVPFTGRWRSCLSAAWINCSIPSTRRPQERRADARAGAGTDRLLLDQIG